MAFLINIENIDEVFDLPKYKPHRLGGDRAGTYSFHVTANWRITFRHDAKKNGKRQTNDVLTAIAAVDSDSVVRAVINFVDEDFFFFSHSNGVVKADQQLLERFAVTANQHSQGLILVTGSSGAGNRAHFTDRDVTVAIDEELDIR